MEENTDRKCVAIAQMEMLAIGGGSSGGYYPPPAVEEPEPPPPVPAAPAAPEKTKAELQLEEDLANKEAIGASKRQGRKATILTRGPSETAKSTTGGGLLSYESMTGLQDQIKFKDKLGA